MNALVVVVWGAVVLGLIAVFIFVLSRIDRRARARFEDRRQVRGIWMTGGASAGGGAVGDANCSSGGCGGGCGGGGGGCGGGGGSGG